tara:strand:- start:172 stop:399 length:228 start_codon:yes stop_codon:yes gene_type:complete
LINIHRVIVPPSPEGDGALIQAQYTLDKNIVSISKLQVYHVINGILGDDIGEKLDLVSHLFITKLVEADLNEAII